MDNRPIGVFDSGVGGLSVWAALAKILPNESMIYFADIKNCPYGYKTKEEITQLSADIIQWLVNENCKLVVVACNTATSNAIDYLRNRFNIPLIGVEPAIKPAAKNTKTGHVGVLATEGTLKSDLFHQTSNKYASHIDITVQIGHGLVELVEAGNLDTSLAEETLRKYIEPMISKGVDQIVLGCTHYPFLIPKMSEIAGDTVKIINPAPAIARHTKNTLLQYKLECQSNQEPAYRFVTLKDTEVFNSISRKALNDAGITYQSCVEVIKFQVPKE